MNAIQLCIYANDATFTTKNNNLNINSQLKKWSCLHHAQKLWHLKNLDLARTHELVVEGRVGSVLVL